MIPKGVQARHPEELPSHRSASCTQKVDFRLRGAVAIRKLFVVVFPDPRASGVEGRAADAKALLEGVEKAGSLPRVTTLSLYFQEFLRPRVLPPLSWVPELRARPAG